MSIERLRVTASHSNKLRHTRHLIIFVIIGICLVFTLVFASNSSSAPQPVHVSGPQNSSGFIPSSPAFNAGHDARSNASTDLVSNSFEVLPFAPLTPQSGGNTVTVKFDELFPGENVETRYSNIRFSSPGLSVYAYAGPSMEYSSQPNSITRGTVFGHDHFADLIVDFPQAVNNVSFTINGVDAIFGYIGQLDYYLNGTLKQSNLLIPTFGRFVPAPVSLQLNGITRVRVHNISDVKGVTFDDFKFTVPAATPTPTPTPVPTPTPLPPPTNLSAAPDELSIDLVWNQSAGATGYIVNRASEVSPSNLVEASPSNLTKEVGLNASSVDASSGNVTVGFVTLPNTVCTNGICKYHDLNLSSSLKYTYAIAATGSPGPSADSNSDSAKPLPKPGCDWKIATGDSGTLQGHGWSVDYLFSDRDGLIITNASLNGRKMVERMSIPYYKITVKNTGQATTSSRGELRLNDSNTGANEQLFSRLINKNIKDMGDRLLLQADYGIDKIPGAPNSCLTISQQYEFFRQGFDVPAGQWSQCEPIGAITTCQKFRPLVTYKFTGREGEALQSINIPQRLQFQVKDLSPNTIAVTRDNDTTAGWFGGGTYVTGHILDKEKSRIPATVEEWWSVIANGGDTGRLDNFHQTNAVVFKGPYLGWSLRGQVWPGCPECVHMHWRWSGLTQNPVFPQENRSFLPEAIRLWTWRWRGSQTQTQTIMSCIRWIMRRR